MADEMDNTTQLKPVTFDKVVDERGVPLNNVLKELHRKLGRLTEISNQINLNLRGSNQAQQTPDNGFEGEDTVDSDVLKAIDRRLQAKEHESVKKAQGENYLKVLQAFPELDDKSDSYDPRFHQLAAEYESKIDKMDPERTLKAAKLAALDTGKMEALTKAKILQDDNRRQRILEEGTSAPTKTAKKAESEVKINRAAVQQFFKIDPSKIEKRIKGE